MSTTLKSKKKPELQALAAELGIDTDGSKADLEARILLHLSEHVELKSDSKYSKYFSSITGPESPGPVVSVAQGSHRRKSVPAKKSTDLGETVSKALTRYVSQTDDLHCLFSCVTDVFSDEEGVTGAELVKKTKRAASSVAKAAENKTKDILANVPTAVPSPSRVSASIERATSQFVRRARSASTSLQLHQVTSRVPIIRQAISNVVSVDGIVTSAEVLLLLSKLIPRTYPVFPNCYRIVLMSSYISLISLPSQFYTQSMDNPSSFPISSISSPSRDSGSHSSLGHL